MKTDKNYKLTTKRIRSRHFLSFNFYLLTFRFHLLTFFSFYLLVISLKAQTPPSSENYIMSVELLEPVSNVNMDQIDDLDDNYKKVSIMYYDDLGREKQSILHKATSDNKDIVTKYEYDGFGRQTRDYLPVPTGQATGIIIDPLQVTGSHYQTTYGQSVWYSQKTLENSPLNRVLKQAAPGNDWAALAGHEIEFAYYSNSATEVDLYWVDTSGNLKKGYYNGDAQYNHYSAKSLSRVITTDENGHQTFEFKDKQGRVILTRSYVEVDVQAGKTDPPSTATEKVDTYYVYDIYGQLAYVVPPKAAAVIPVSSGTVSSTIINGLCYSYKYDNRNRMIERRLPGKGLEYLVYDKQNRLVATQDAEMGKTTFTLPSGTTGKAWAFTRYDKFGRVVMTGIALDARNRNDLQLYVNTWGDNNTLQNGTTYTSGGNTIYYQQTSAFPGNAAHDVLTVNYYDNYITAMMTADAVAIPTSVEGQTDIRSGASQPDKSLKGMPVASHVRVLPDAGWERIYTFYDSKSRPVRTHKKNHLEGHTRTDLKLKFRGMPEFTRSYHKRTASGTQVIVKDNFTYDNRERMVRHTQVLNNIAQNEQLISLNQYDLLGQLKSKKVGGTDLTGTNRWQEVKYKYNIRGWLTDINDVGTVLLGKDAVPPTPTDALFSFKILYNQLVNGAPAYGEELYNGNIAQTLWKTGSDNKLRGYVYNYDRLNRMTDAVFYKQDNNPFVGTYNEHLAYDVNGNITSLKRFGGYESQTLPDQMDLLAYTYTANSNLLVKVIDDGQDNTGFIDSPTNTTNDYTYDANGNMTGDKNKGITSIKYNHLNLPTDILFGNGNSIQYIYNAAGQKVKKFVGAYTVTTGNPYVKEVDYLDGFQYTGEELNFFPHAEGYVNVVLGTTGNRIFNYVYNYTDHLGNIRLSYTKDMVSNQLKILEENHYYPFGLKHQKYTASATGLKAIDENTARPGSLTSTPYNYKYNGQEWQDELGLNMYDMDMRQYDPAIARWVVLDPVIHHSMSPYNAFDNNPVFWADPSGADAVGSVFQDLGTEVAGFTNMATGFSVGGGGGQTSYNGEEGAKATTDPGKKSWFGRMLGKIGKLFGGGGKATGTVDTSGMTWGIADDVDTTTRTYSNSIEENPWIELSIEHSETEGKSGGVINKDAETVTDDSSPSNNQLKTNSQLNIGSLVGTVYGSNTEVGASLQQSLGGLVGVSVNGSINFATGEHSSIGIRFHENVNLNNRSSSIGGGIKPVGIMAVAAGYIMRGFISPIMQYSPSLVPPTTIATTK